MPETIIDPARSLSNRIIAAIAFLCFAPCVASFAVVGGVWWVDYPGIGFHLAMFLLVSRLRAPEWARAAGYGWLVLDVTTGVLTLNQVPHSTADFVRLGGHIFGGIWMATASLQGSRAVKIVGVIAGLWLSSYSFVSPFLPMTFIGPTAILFLIWLAIISWQDGAEPRGNALQA